MADETLTGQAEEEWLRGLGFEPSDLRITTPVPEGQRPPVMPAPGAAAPEDPERRRLQREAATPEERSAIENLERTMIAAGQGSALVPPQRFRSLSNRAIEAGIGMEGASTAARFNMGLAFGSVTDVPGQLEVVRRAIENDIAAPVEVRVGPLNELEWRRRGERQWDLVNGAGFVSGLRDIIGSVPEIATMMTGAAGGIGGHFAGTRGVGPRTGVAGDIIGAGMAEALAEGIRLYLARDQGLIDWDNERILTAAAQRGGIASAGTGAAAGGLAVLRRILDFARGTPTSAINTILYDARGRPRTGPPSIEAGMMDAEELRRRVLALGGQDFPMTAGQVSAMPGVRATSPGQAVDPSTLPPGSASLLLAQERARTMGEAGAPVREVLGQQATARTAATDATFGAEVPSAREIAGRAVQGAINAIRFRRVARDEARLGEFRTQAELAGRDVAIMPQALGGDLSTAELMNVSRDALTAARADVFAPFSQMYRNLQAETGFEINLAPFRDAATQIEARFGRGLLDPISIRGQDNLVRLAREAGIEVTGIINGVRILRDNPADLGQAMQTIADINEVLRVPALRNISHAEPVLRQLRDGIMDSIRVSAGPEMFDRITSLQQAYSRSIEQFDSGLIGQFLQRNRWDVYEVTGDQATEALIRDPTLTRAFVNSLFTRQEIDPLTGARITNNLPDAPVALRAAQDAVLSRIVREYRDYQTGTWNTSGLSTFLSQNQESLQMLFVRGPRLANEANPTLQPFSVREFPLDRLNEIRLFTNAGDRLQQRQTAALRLFDERFGVYTSDPAVMVQTLVTEGRVTDLRNARRIVERVYGAEGVERFNHGLTSQVRSLVTNADGVVDPQRIDAFLGNASGRAVTGMLGEQFTRNLTTLRDLTRVMNLRGTGNAVDIAREFGFGIPRLRGWLNYLRVIAPPLSARGRGLTATLGIANEQTQRQIGALLADPARLNEFIRAAERVRDPLAQGTRIQLTRMGFGHIPQLWDYLDKFHGITVDNIEGQEPIPGRTALPEYPNP